MAHVCLVLTRAGPCHNVLKIFIGFYYYPQIMTKTKTIAMILLAAIATVGITAIQIPSTFAACTGNPHDFGSGPTGNPHDPGETGN